MDQLNQVKTKGLVVGAAAQVVDLTSAVKGLKLRGLWIRGLYTITVGTADVTAVQTWATFQFFEKIRVVLDNREQCNVRGAELALLMKTFAIGRSPTGSTITGTTAAGAEALAFNLYIPFTLDKTRYPLDTRKYKAIGLEISAAANIAGATDTRMIDSAATSTCTFASASVVVVADGKLAAGDINYTTSSRIRPA